MYAFSFVRPDTLSEAVAFLKDNPEARPLSGGMTLIPTLKQRLAAPSHLVDLTRLQELKGIVCDGHVLRIGAATPHAEVARSKEVSKAIPALARLAGMIADPQVRNRGTIGGSVANNDPAADFPAAVLGLKGSVITTSRCIPADEFFIGMFETALEDGELVVGLEFPVPDRASYVKYRHPASGYAVTGIFAAQFKTEVRVAVTGAGPSVFRWKEAEAALRQNCSVEALKDLVIDHGQVLDDIHTPAPYRANLVEVFTRHAVAALTSSAV